MNQIWLGKICFENRLCSEWLCVSCTHGWTLDDLHRRSSLIAVARCPRGLCTTKKTLTPATWITRQPYTPFWCLCVIFVYPPWCQSLVCSPLLYFCQLVSFSVPPTLHTARLGGSVLCSGLRGARGARAMPPHVHPGWKVRTLRTERSGLLEKTCLLRSACLSLGKGRRGWAWEYVRIEREKRRKKKISASEDKWRIYCWRQLR